MSATAVTLVGNTGTVMTCTYATRAGLTEDFEFQYNNGLGLIKINGVPQTTTVSSMATTFGSMFCNQTANNFDGGVMYWSILNTRIGEADSARLYTYFRNLYPTRFWIGIGNQAWDVENWGAVVTGNSTVLPEIQTNAESGNAEFITGGDFESGLIGTMVMPDGVATWGLNTSSPISVTQDGLLAVTSAGTNS
jgi:hypothetical protein